MSCQSEYENYRAWIRSLTKNKLKKIQHNKRLEPGHTCEMCGGQAEHTHEMIYGRGRRLPAIHYKLQCKLCNECHTYIHNNPKSREAISMKRQAQMIFEEQYSRDDFIKIFGRNYLDDDDQTGSN